MRASLEALLSKDILKIFSCAVVRGNSKKLK